MTVDCCGHDTALRMANERADRWQQRADEARAVVDRIRRRLDEWGDWPITAEGQAADMRRDLLAALEGGS